MKHTWIYGLALMLALTACVGGQDPDNVKNKTLAFPHAEGGGKYTTGGRGGQICHVTTLDDDPKKPGSLRYCVNQPGARIVIFDVAGIINLKTPLAIVEGALTIAGQSAPGDGICIAGAPVLIKTSNVIIRFLRFRMGDGYTNPDGGDALSCDGGRKNILLDHCSFSWSTDECVSCYGNTSFTLQWCIASEALRKSQHYKGNHSYGGIWGGTDASFHHNLLAHHDSRNPRFDHDYVDAKCHGPVDFVNNVVYNWGSHPAYGGEGYTEARKINMVNNYYKYGPSTDKKSRLVEPTVSCEYCEPKGTLIPGRFFLSGNYMFGSAEVTADNWKGSSQTGAAVKAEARWTDGLTALTLEETALQAYESVLTKAGASLRRDAVDTRVVNDVRNGTGKIINSQVDVGGWPVYSGTPAADADNDGIPDTWETEHGLNPNEFADAKATTLAAPYTNLEVYLNALVEHLY